MFQTIISTLSYTIKIQRTSIYFGLIFLAPIVFATLCLLFVFVFPLGNPRRYWMLLGGCLLLLMAYEKILPPAGTLHTTQFDFVDGPPLPKIGIKLLYIIFCFLSFCFLVVFFAITVILSIFTLVETVIFGRILAKFEIDGER